MQPKKHLNTTTGLYEVTSQQYIQCAIDGNCVERWTAKYFYDEQNKKYEWDYGKATFIACNPNCTLVAFEDECTGWNYLESEGIITSEDNKCENNIMNKIFTLKQSNELH